MKATIVSLLLSLGIMAIRAAGGSGTLENSALAWHWIVVDKTLRPERLDDKLNGGSLQLTGDCFQLVFGDGQTLKASNCELVKMPELESLKPDPSSPLQARHSPGRQLVAKFTAPGRNVIVEWRVVLRDGATYLRQELSFHAQAGDAVVKEIVLFEQPVPGAETMGTVDGSPATAGNFFLGYEHPMSRNAVESNHVVRCSFLRNAVLKKGETLTQSFVIGVAPEGQMRRGFLAYIEQERAHPYRPFLHYNSWYDIAWNRRKFTEAETLNAIEQFGRELVQKRGVAVQSFLLDDGWDDSHTMWGLHSGFPNGFTRVKEAAAKLNCSIGVWLSPFGGYDVAKAQRLAYGSPMGFETNASGFSLAGPKYYQRFRNICLEMVDKYDVNMFKFDGLAAGAKAGASGLTRDGDAMLRLVADLRAAKPDIYINQTTGTWPSPFWLLYVDSTWRGGSDHSFHGKGSPRQQWITYRDSMTWQNAVQRGPLYPLNSLMLHGIIFATNAAGLQSTDDQDFADEVHDFFGTGTQLQELYITPTLLNQTNWNDLADAAKWARANADVLGDTHWVGGDPGKGEVYGWASWSPRKAVLVLRNPGDKPARYSVDARTVFELPARAPKAYRTVALWNKTSRIRPELRAGEPNIFALQPFEVLVVEATPNSSVEN
jgi:hypothetical protein